MVHSLDNLANAAVQKNDTVEKLVLTNTQLATANATLTEHIARLQAHNTTLLKLVEKHTLGGTSVDKITPTDNYNAWDPTGYCWTHGFKVKKGHTSKSCKTRNDGHQEGAIQQNTMGGNQSNVKWTPKS